MSVALLILLPILLSGYLFAIKTEVISYGISRLEGYHLYFASAIYGVYIVLLSVLIVLLLNDTVIWTWLSPLKSKFEALFSIKQDVALFEVVVVAVQSMILASIVARIVNYAIDEQLAWVVSIQNDDFELLLMRALVNDDLIQVTMENGKVYVGFVIRGFQAKEERKYLRILPIYSGHRGESGKVKHTTPYGVVIENMTENIGDEQARLKLVTDFELVLPVSDIKSAHIFNNEAWDEFNMQKPSRKSKS